MNSNHEINLNHLVTFIKIAESKNLTVAAKVLKQDKTRLSRVLKELEEMLGVELIYRTTRQFQLTEAGARLYKRCQPALLSLQNTTSELTSHDGDLKGHIRITGAHGVFSRLIPSIIADFSATHPQVTFDIVFAQQGLDIIREGIDLAIRMGQPKESGLKMLKLADFRLILVASPLYLKKSDLITLESLRTLRLLMLESMNNKPLRLIDNKGNEEEISLTGSITSNDPDTLLAMTLKGLGASLLPEVLVQSHLQTKELVHILPAWTTHSLPISLLFANRKKIPPHIRAFANFLADSFRKDF